MLTFMWALLLAGVVLIVNACGRGPRTPGVSWFLIRHEMLPATKKALGRMQQTAAHRRRKKR